MSQINSQLMKGFIILSAFVFSPGLGSTLVKADTLLTRIYVEDISGGLANSPASPVAPLLDPSFVLNPLFTFLDTVGADSVTLYFPDWDPADSLYTRPDGSIAKLEDRESLYLFSSNFLRLSTSSF